MHDFNSRLCSIELLTEIMRVCLFVWRMKLLFLINPQQWDYWSVLVSARSKSWVQDQNCINIDLLVINNNLKLGTLHSVSGFLSPDPQLLRGKRETPDKLLVTNVNWVLPTLNTQHFYLIMFTPESGVVTGCSGEITSPHHILGIVTHWGWTLQYVKITQRYRQFHFPSSYHLNTPNFLLPTPIFHTILNLFIRFLFGSFFMFVLTWLFWRCWKSIF